MRLLANENFPLDAVQALRTNGHDVAWIREDARGSADDKVLIRAQEEKRILITFDKDFGELAFRSKLPADCGIILFRINARILGIYRPGCGTSACQPKRLGGTFLSG